MKPKRRSQRESQLGLFQPPAQTPAWERLTEDQKRAIRRILCRMMRDAVDRTEVGATTSEASDE
jgi:hypothetical protein